MGERADESRDMEKEVTCELRPDMSGGVEGTWKCSWHVSNHCAVKKHKETRVECPGGTWYKGGCRCRWAPEHAGLWRTNKGFCVQLKGNGKPKEGLNRGGHAQIMLVALEDKWKGTKVGVGIHIIREIFIKLHWKE